MYLQYTINGRDAGGFVFQNVGHVHTDYAGTDSVFATAGHLCDWVIAQVFDTYAACLCPNASLLACTAKGVGADDSVTNIRGAVRAGTRGADQQPGGVCGRIVFVPDGPSMRVSSMFIPGAAEGDFVDDSLASAYEILLNALGDAFLSFDGSEPTYAWQLVQFHPKTLTADDINEFYVSSNPTLMNKRVRA